MHPRNEPSFLWIETNVPALLVSIALGSLSGGEIVLPVERKALTEFLANFA